MRYMFLLSIMFIDKDGGWGGEGEEREIESVEQHR